MQSEPYTPAPAIGAAASSYAEVAAAKSVASETVAKQSPPIAPAASAKPPRFQPIAPSIYVSRPSDSDRASAAASTDLAPLQRLDISLPVAPRDVVIFGWMNAPIRLVSKYAVPYTVLFPSANVYIKLSNGKSYLSSENKRKKDLEPLAEHVCADVGIPTKDLGDSTVTLIEVSQTLSNGGDTRSKPNLEGLIIHSFSDGGAGNLSLFLSMLPQSAAAPRIHSLVMDSSPGKSSPSSGASAFTMPLANRPALRAVVRALVFIGLYLLKLWTRLKGQPSRAEKMRGTLNALKTWSWVTAAAPAGSGRAAPSTPTPSPTQGEFIPPRMYLYSKADKLIPWRYVEEHARELAEMRQIGTGPRLIEMQSPEAKAALSSASEASGTMTVELRRWDTAPHCGIVRTDFEGYWTAVMQFYRAVLSAGNASSPS